MTRDFDPQNLTPEQRDYASMLWIVQTQTEPQPGDVVQTEAEIIMLTKMTRDEVETMMMAMNLIADSSRLPMASKRFIADDGTVSYVLDPMLREVIAAGL